MVTGKWEDGATARRGPRRRIYRLSQKGRRRFDEVRGEFQLFVNVIGGILGASA